MKSTSSRQPFPLVLVLAGCIGLCAAPVGAQTPAVPPQTAAVKSRAAGIEARLVIKVVHPEDVKAALVERARQLGGFPSLITDDRLLLRVPHQGLTELSELAVASGALLERTLASEDIADEIAQLEAQRKSKTEMLERLHGLLDGAPLDGTLRVEQSLTQLVLELEQVKGSLRLLRHRAKFAVLDVAFRFPERDRVVYVSSPFEWLNSVDLDRFLGDF